MSYNVQCTIYNIQLMYKIQCTMYNVHPMAHDPTVLRGMTSHHMTSSETGLGIGIGIPCAKDWESRDWDPS